MASEEKSFENDTCIYYELTYDPSTKVFSAAVIAGSMKPCRFIALENMP